MSKIFILSCLCLVILYVNYVDAQNRPNRPVKPVRRPYKTPPPPRVLNIVEPKGRARQQRLQIRQRQMSNKPNTHGKIKPAQVKAYQHEWCEFDPEGRWASEDECDTYFYCDEYGDLQEYWCPPEKPILDYLSFFCMTEDEGGRCLPWDNDDNWDAECPSDPYEVFFLPGGTCNDYYICLSGWPTLLDCAPGQHWNQIRGYCDSPLNAQCDVSL